jgi:hypothetical protein
MDVQRTADWASMKQGESFFPSLFKTVSLWVLMGLLPLPVSPPELFQYRKNAYLLSTGNNYRLAKKKFPYNFLGRFFTDFLRLLPDNALWKPLTVAIFRIASRKHPSANPHKYVVKPPIFVWRKPFSDEQMA